MNGMSCQQVSPPFMPSVRSMLLCNTISLKPALYKRTDRLAPDFTYTIVGDQVFIKVICKDQGIQTKPLSQCYRIN